MKEYAELSTIGFDVAVQRLLPESFEQGDGGLFYELVFAVWVWHDGVR